MISQASLEDTITYDYFNSCRKKNVKFHFYVNAHLTNLLISKVRGTVRLNSEDVNETAAMRYLNASENSDIGELLDLGQEMLFLNGLFKNWLIFKTGSSKYYSHMGRAAYSTVGNYMDNDQRLFKRIASRWEDIDLVIYGMDLRKSLLKDGAVLIALEKYLH